MHRRRGRDVDIPRRRGTPRPRDVGIPRKRVTTAADGLEKRRSGPAGEAWREALERRAGATAPPPPLATADNRATANAPRQHRRYRGSLELELDPESKRPDLIGAAYEDAAHAAGHLQALYGSLLHDNGEHARAATILKAVCPHIWRARRADVPTSRGTAAAGDGGNFAETEERRGRDVNIPWRREERSTDSVGSGRLRRGCHMDSPRGRSGRGHALERRGQRIVSARADSAAGAR